AVALTSADATSEEIYVASRLGGTFSAATVAGNYGIAGYARQDAPVEKQSASGVLTLNADGTYSATGNVNSNLTTGVGGFSMSGTYTVAANGAISLTSTEWGDTLTGYVVSDGTIMVALTSADAT